MKQYKLSDSLEKASLDYIYLLNKLYPPHLIAKIVGDRYKLVAFERNMLVRGIYKATDIEQRKKITLKSLNENNIVSFDKNKNFKFLIDGYNVLFTVMNYLKGVPLFISNDGFLKDCGNSKGQVKNLHLLKKACTLVFDFLFDQILFKDYCDYENTSTCILYLDSPVSGSGKHKKIILELLENYNYAIETKLVKNADKAILEQDNAIVCTADSYIIDSIVTKSKHMSVFDLAYNVLKFYSPDFMSFSF